MVLRGVERATDIPQLDAKGRSNNGWALVGESVPGGKALGIGRPASLVFVARYREWIE
jgi:hypothetical protein